ncbi:palmitoyltransferase [Caerostris darwini]|uniref:Palmitoyltransferase n=1 Tax=Caerostris darwini TaxID=1538125 RepID=A0AAV4QNQ4_9ARAC|nr:palmitoyltransferase [Caerostris darwini]
MCFVASMCLCVFVVKSNVQPTLPIVNTSERNASKAELMKKVRCELCACVQPARTYHCDLCGVCVHKRDHHSIWLDTCIGSKNQKYFMGALVALLFCCFYSSNLTLTTICHPTLMGGLLLIPDDCSDVFGDIHIAICFVSSVYTLMIAALGIFLLFQQLWLVTHNTTYQEWQQGQMGLYSKGCFRNLVEFFCGTS